MFIDAVRPSERAPKEILAPLARAYALLVSAVAGSYAIVMIKYLLGVG